ncbi:MAG: nitrogen fixation protein NifQ [Gammaproteobacteria bacterium]|nr:nitrogen fixation protein NifQ [Gammaproteobacteria bacterium]MCP5424165.1 nitrogen fixation protein NifQ [Gammaproteobacteria bacterium]
MATAPTGDRQSIYDYLVGTARCDDENTDALARMLATHHSGGGAMPADLGLGDEQYAQMMEHHFPGRQLPPGRTAIPDGWDVRLAEERQELVKLMMIHRVGNGVSEKWISTIVASGCMASDHLWHDLGLWSRGDLSALMTRNFPALAAKNNRDMRWKKFLYKQLCEQEGIYMCRAPSCEQCVDYSVCFSPEE